MGRTLEIGLKINGSEAELSSLANALRGIGAGAGVASPDVAKLEQQIKSLQEQIKGLKEHGDEAGSSFEELQDTMKEFAEGPLRTTNREIIHLLTGMGGFAAIAASVAVGVGLIGAGMYELVESQAEAAEGLEHMSIKMGLTLGQTEHLSQISKVAGVSLEGLQGSARFLANALEDSAGTGKRASDALAKLGVATHDVQGETRSMGDIMVDVIQKLGTMENASQRAFMAQQIFPRGAAQEVQILADKYKEANEILEQFGIHVDEDATRNLAHASEEIHAIGLAWDMFKKGLADKITPIVIPILMHLTPPQGSRVDMLGIDHDFNAQRIDPSVGENRQQDFNTATSSLTDSFNKSFGANKDQLNQGTGQADRFKAQHSRSIEAMKEALQQGQKDAKDFASKASQEGMLPEAQKKAQSDFEKQERTNNQLEASIKKAEEYKTLMQRFDDLLLEAQKADSTAMGKIEIERQEFIKKGLSQKQASELTAPKAREEMSKMLGDNVVRNATLGAGPQDPTTFIGGSVGKMIAEGVKKSNEQAEKDLKLTDEEFGKAMKEQETALAETGKQLEQQLKIYTDFEMKQATTTADVELSRRQRVRASTKTPGSDSSGDVISDMNLQIALAKQLASIQADAANRSFEAEQDALNASVTELNQAQIAAQITANAEKNQTELLQIRATLEDQITQQRVNAENKIADMQMEDLKQYHDAAGKIFDAIRGGPKSIQSSIKDFAFGQAKDIFSNIMAKPLQAIGTQAHELGSKSGLGDILSGTIFSPKPQGNADVTANTTALQGTTASLNNLTTAITGSTNGAAATSVNPGGLIGEIADSQSPTGISTTIDSVTQLAKAGGQTLSSGLGIFPSDSSGIIPDLGGPSSDPSSVLGSLAKALSIPTAGGQSLSTGAGIFGPSDENGVPIIPGVTDGSLSSDSTSSSGFFGSMAKAMGIGGGPAGAGTGLLGTLFGSGSGTGKAMAGLGAAGALFGGVSGVMGGLRQGGAQGDLDAVSSGLGAAGALLGPAGIPLDIAAIGTKLIAGLLGDPRVNRQRAITSELTAAQYNAPNPISISETTGGLMDTTNYRGQNQIINAKPTIGQYTEITGFNPDYGKNNDLLSTPERYVTPGSLLPAPSAQVQPVVVQVSTMDSKSFNDNASMIAGAVRTAMQQGHPLNSMVQSVVKPH